MSTPAQKNHLEIVRHSLSHVMAAAVQKLYPKVKFGIGPVIENGFYYDLEITAEQRGIPRGTTRKILTPEDLPKIEQEMQKMIKEDIKFEKKEIAIDEAIKLFKKLNQPYKVELLNDIKKHGTTKLENVTQTFRSAKKNQTPSTKHQAPKVFIYQTGNFIDLCHGPHVKSTAELKNIAFRVDRLAGAYWRGNEKNQMLTRIYGTAFGNKNELADYLKLLAEAEKRDHRRLGKDLDLFSVDPYVGPGLVLWHPKLSILREEIELYWRQEHRKHGYQYVYTPHLGLDNLWQTSGHLDFFKESMYPPMTMADKDARENSTYYVKPMNCPFHIRVYKSRPRSYRELPLRWCELGSVYRYEESGVVHGMLRVRGFTQDDAHIFCREDQFAAEVNYILDFALEINHAFGYDNLKVYLSLRGQKDKNKYVGEERVWQLSEKTLEEVLEKRGLAYQKDVGGAKFYGPSIDLKAVDALNREWQGTTIQLDMNLPSRFEMVYTDKDGREKTPIMLHRTLLGSMERFVGTLIEHYAGAFPLWLAPVQIVIITVGSTHEKHSCQLAEEFKKENLRVEVWSENETVANKIRQAIVQKIPYMLVIGDKEMKSDKLHLRKRGSDKVIEISKNEFVENVKKLVKEKTQEL